VAAIRPTRLRRIVALRGARTAANHWSETVDAGIPVAEALADSAFVAELLQRTRRPPGLRTRLDAQVLAWRFGLPALAYRVVSDGPERGAAFVRVRRRGDAREGVVVLLLVADRGEARRLLARVRRELGREADYLLAIGGLPGFLPARRLGPIVTARAIAGVAPADVGELALELGDLELF
jgi:hypothetical protein